MLVTTNTGQNKDGVYHFVFYGHAYCKIQDPLEKLKLKNQFGLLMDIICDE